MSKTIDFTASELTINGVQYPLRLGALLAKQCALAARLKRESEAVELARRQWLDWCTQNNWSPQNSPALLIEANDRTQQLYHDYIASDSLHLEHKNHWAQLMSDSIFTQIYAPELSADELDAMAKDIVEHIPMTGRQRYEGIVEKASQEDAAQAAAILRLGKMLSVHGIVLEWPTPPFTVEFYAALAHTFEFQLRWQLQVLAEYATLSKAARQDLVDLKWPINSEELSVWLQELHAVKQHHGVLRLSNGLSDFERRKQKCIEYWMVIWAQCQHDMPLLLSLIQQGTGSRSVEEQLSFLYQALIRPFGENKTVLERVQSYEETLRFELAVEAEHHKHHLATFERLKQLFEKEKKHLLIFCVSFGTWLSLTWSTDSTFDLLTLGMFLAIVLVSKLSEHRMTGAVLQSLAYWSTRWWRKKR